MVEQDYIMRLIKEMVRTLLKLIFHIELDNPLTELFKETEKKNTLQNLLDMIDSGNINDAENKIYEITSDVNALDAKENLKTALIFYFYLNEKNNEFLESHDFSREEVKQGLMDLVDRYGLNSIADSFLSDIM